MSASSAPQVTHLPIVAEGDGCLEILLERLRAKPGISGLEADFARGTLTVRYDPAQVSPDDLNGLAAEMSTLFAQRVTACEHRRTQDACAECALRLGRVPETERGEFDVTAEPQRVGLSRHRTPPGVLQLVRPLADTKAWGETMTPAEQSGWSKGRIMAVLTVACLALLISGFVLGRFAATAAFAPYAFGGSAIAGGWFTLRSTIRSLGRGRFDVNLLMLLAAIGAASIGYVMEAAVLMFLFSLSNTLEVYTMGRTRQALHALLKLRPTRALVRRGGREVEVDAEAVQVGEQVIVKPGGAIPVDGVVVQGESLVDQSSLTGESMPVPKAAGDRVFAGTLSQQGSLEVRTTRVAGDTTLARIVALVQEAQEQKSRTEEVADWVGRYYTVAVIVGAGLLIAIPPLVLHHPFAASFYRAMTLLVVASPCALVIATPATILSAIAFAARNGILFKGGRSIEALGRVRAVAFDKTGTLTRGRFEVTRVAGLGGVSEAEVLAWAACAEKRSQHPLAQAVVRAAERQGLDVTPAEQLTSHLGKGLVAIAGGESIHVGTPELFVPLAIAVPGEALTVLDAARQAGETGMLVHRAGRWGVIAAADVLRDTSPDVVAALRKLGVASIVLLSGDHPGTVEAIARRAGVDRHHGGLLPEDKVRVLGEIEQEIGPAAMVGDGVNDAPALARASVGIAMGGIGSDAAMESADVVLMSDDLRALPVALRLCQRARRVVIQNVCIAVGVMLVLVALVFLGPFTPLGALRLPVAVSGHEGSTVVVILNGLRLLGGKRAS